MSQTFVRQLARSTSNLRYASSSAPRHLSFAAAAPSIRLFSTSKPAMTVQEIKSFDQFKSLINGDKPVIIDFWATWCGPCRFISPVFEKLSEGVLGEKLVFAKLDVDDQAEVAQECGIKAMPTFIIFQGGEKKDSVLGADVNKLQATINGFVSTL